MAEVKWIKMKVGMFDGMSFKKIKRAKIGGESFRDKLTAVWFELMDFAGKCNHDGEFIGTNEIPFTELSDIATMIDRDEEELRLCMAFYIQEGMVTIIDDIYSLANWAEYQNKEGLDKIREQNRLRQAKYKQKQKLLGNVTDNVMVTQGNATDIDIEKEIDTEKDNIYMRSAKTQKPQKHKYGEYNNVLLTDDELEKLKAEYIDYEDRIERLSSYIASTGKAYKSHYATIRNWARKDNAQPVKTVYQKQTKADELNDAYAMMAAWAEGRSEE